jgi:hypothetical protein
MYVFLMLMANGKISDMNTCDAEEFLYVVEITDPCGFSTYAQFCCSDVSATPHGTIQSNRQSRKLE